MAGKNLKVALQVQADLNQAKREIGSLKDTIQDTTKAADAATASQGKTSKAVAITADEVKKLSGTTNLKDGIKQVSDYENWLGKTSVASKNVADSNKLIEKSITSLTPHLTALVGLSGGFIAIAVDTLNKAAELQNLSSVTGMNVEEFQYSAAAAKKVGIEVDQLSQIFQDSRDKVGDYIAEGGGELQQFFDEIAPKVGVTAKQFEKLNGDQILQLYVKTLQEAGVSQNEMVTHMERMASDSTRLIPIYENNAAALKKYGDAAKESGAILSQELVDNAKKAKSALGDFQMGVEGVTNKLVANAAPAIVFVAENLDVLVRAGLIVASVFAGKMITSTAATALAFITARYEAIKYQLSLTGVSSVATTTAARLTALSTVSRLLTAAGGLPGLAIAAAGVAASFLLMPSSAEAATNSLDNQSKTVAELAEEYKKLDQAQQRIAVRDAVQKQEELTQAYKNQQSELASLIEMGTRSSDVSDEQRQKALELVESYKSGKISASQLTAEYQKLTTVKESFRARADEVAVATNNAKQAMDKQNLIIDVYTGKADAAALASNGLSGDLDSVGTSADGAANKVQGLNKAFTDYLKKTKENIASNKMQTILMDKFNFSDAQAKAVTEARLAKGDISDRSLDLTVKEQNLILAGVKAEEDKNKFVQDRQKLEKENTKEKEKQYSYSQKEVEMLQKVAKIATENGFAGIEAQHGLPKNMLSALVAQESKGDRNAKSPTGAYGLFQTTSIFRKQYGLTKADSYDNIPKVANAAAQALVEAYEVFGNWEDAITAYNAGITGTSNLIKTGFTSSQAKTKEAKGYAPAVNKWLVALNGSNKESSGFIEKNAADEMKDWSEFQDQMRTAAEKQRTERITIDLRFATEPEKLKKEYDDLVKQINDAGYDSETLKTRLQQAEQEYQDKLSKRPEILKRVQDSMSSLDESWLRSSGNDLEADLNAIDEKWKQTQADLASLMMSEPDQLQANEYQQMLVKIDFVIDREKLTLQFNDAMKQLDELQNLRSQRQNTLKLQYDSGQISRPQYADGLNSIDTEMKPKMQELIDKAGQLAEKMGDAFNAERIKAMNVELNQTDQELTKFLPTADQIIERIASGMTDAIMAWADGTKSASDAFREFASSFLREIAQMILKQMIFNALKAITGYSDGGLVTGFATGGYTGEGGKYQPAGIVHKDEFVIRKESTNQPGAKEFLANFNRHGMDALNKFKGYADGGLVDAPTITVPDIQAPKLNDPAAKIASSTSFSANQNFYLVDDPARILDVLKSGASQENLVVMMSRDPAKFKSALQLGD